MRPSFFPFRFPAIMACLIALATPHVLHAQAVSPPITSPEVECTPSLVFNDGMQIPNYDPFASGPLVYNSDIAFENADCGKNVSVEASIGWSGISPRLTNNGAELAFSLSIAGTEVTSSDGGLSGSAGVSLALPPVQSGSLPNLVRLVIREGQVVPPGFYILEAPINTRINISSISRSIDLKPESSFEADSNVVRIETEVLAVLKLGVTGCDLTASGASSASYRGSSFDLASSCKLVLGDPQLGMANGDEARARLTGLTNVNFVIAMNSRNGGMLTPVGSGNNVRETEQIRYTASVQSQGQEFTFDCGASTCGSSRTIEPSLSPLGTDLYFKVRVSEPDIKQKRAGNYSDVITLIIQPAS